MEYLKKLTAFVSRPPKGDDEEALLKSSQKDEETRNTTSKRKDDDPTSASSHESHAATDGNDAPPSSALQAVFKSVDIAATLANKMFRQTNWKDKLILVIGALLAFIHGFTFPFVAVVFGSLTNSYVQQAIHGYANSTTSNQTTIVVEPGGLYAFTQSLLNLPDEPDLLPNATELGLPEGMASTLELINKIMVETFYKEQVLTKEEFVGTVHATGLLFCMLAVGIFVCSFLQFLCWEIVAVNQSFRLREQVIRNILRQDLTWFMQHNTNVLLSNIYSEVERFRDGVGFKSSIVLEYIAMFAAAALIALGTSYKLALVFLLVTPFIIYRILKFVKLLAAESSEATKKWIAAERTSAQALLNIDTVVAYGEQENEINRYGEKLEESVDLLFKEYHLSAMGNALLAAIIYGCYAVAFWYSCRLLVQHSISAGEIYTLFLAITMLSIAIQNLSTMVSTVSSSFQAAKSLEEFTDRIPEIDWDFSSPLPPLWETDKKMFHEDIEFKSINFMYPGKAAVLKDLSFTIKGGETVAIVGGAGSGKSTIACLLLRLYDPACGEIRIGQVNIKSLDVPTLRAHICLSLNNIHMTNKNVHKNIRAGRKLITHGQIKDVMKLIGRFELCDKGQAVKRVEDYTSLQLLRKIDLARALVTDPPVLILDDSFSDLLEAERNEIRERILEHRRGKTTIILTSHFGEVKDVDTIFVLKDGQILQENIGTYEKLMSEKHSHYALMVNSETVLQAMKAQLSQVDPSSRTAETSSVRFASFPLRDEATSVTDFIMSLLTPESKKLWIIGFLGCLITGCQMTVLSAYFVQIFGTFSKTGAELTDQGIFWAGMLMALSIIAAIGIWLRNLFASTAGLYLMLSLKITSFTSALRRPKSYYDKAKTTPTELGIKMMRNSEFIKTALETPVQDGVSSLVTIFFICVLISTLVWQIGLIALFGVLPVILLLATAQYKFQKRARRSISKIDDKSSEIICKALEHIKLTHAYCMQRSYLVKYLKYANIAYGESRNQAIRCAIVGGMCESVFFLFCGSSFLYGAYMIQVDAIDPQSLFKIFFAVAFCVSVFRQPVGVTPDLAEAVVSLEQINDLINEENTFASSLDPLNAEGEPIESMNGRIEFHNVSFEYSCRDVVLRDLFLVIPAGSTLGLTGRSGFGGSTVLQLVERFYDPTGNLTVDGSSYQHRLRNYNIQQLRRHIGWIPQEIVFFDGSLADNIKYGCQHKEQMTADRLQTVLETVKLGDEFKDALDIPRDSNYWDNLSRGKKVQIAIARALARDPKILLIDSPTESMSADEKTTVLDVLCKVKQNRTTILVSKCSQTLAVADSVAIIDGGRMVQQAKLGGVEMARITSSIGTEDSDL